VLLAADAHEHLVDGSAPVTEATHRADTLAAANSGPSRSNQKRIVSWQMSMPRSNKTSSTFRNERWKCTYIRPTSRITSGDELNRLNEAGDLALDRRGILPATGTSNPRALWSDSTPSANSRPTKLP